MTGRPWWRRHNWMRSGFLADGVFKLAVAIAYLAATSLAAEAIPVGGWLVLVAAGVMVASGVAEVAFALRRATRSHVPPLVMFDTGWVVVTVVALVLAGRGAEGLAWQLWFGYQAVAAPVVALIFALAVRRPAAAV